MSLHGTTGNGVSKGAMPHGRPRTKTNGFSMNNRIFLSRAFHGIVAICWSHGPSLLRKTGQAKFMTH